MPRQTLHSVDLPVTHNGLTHTTTQRDQCFGFHSRPERQRHPILDGCVVEDQGAFLLLRHRVVDEDGWFVGLPTHRQKAFHGREGHAREALVALDALKVGLGAIGRRVADDVVARWEDDALIIDEVEVVADGAIQPKYVFELDLLRRLYRGNHILYIIYIYNYPITHT